MGDSVPLRISIVMPVKDSEGMLVETIRSIQDQTEKNFELICIDDKSSDNSKALIEEIGREDKRIAILEGNGGGAGEARNIGMEHARGRFLIFLDSDDLFYPNMLKSMADALDSSSADMCICGYDQIVIGTNAKKRRDQYVNHKTADGFHRLSEFKSGLFQITSGVPWNKMYRTSFVMDHDIRYQEIKRTNDIAFYALAMAYADSVYLINQPLLSYRSGFGGSLTDIRNIYPYSPLDAAEYMYSSVTNTGLLNKSERDSLKWLCFEQLTIALKNSAVTNQLGSSEYMRMRRAIESWDLSYATSGGNSALRLILWAFKESTRPNIIWAFRVLSNRRHGNTTKDYLKFSMRLVFAGINSRFLRFLKP